MQEKSHQEINSQEKAGTEKTGQRNSHLEYIIQDYNRQEKKKKRQRQIRRRILLLLLLFIAAAGGSYLYVRFAPTTKRMEPKAYFETMLSRAAESDSVTLGEGELAVMLQDHVSPYKAKLHDGAVYLHYDMVRENISTRFFLDEQRSLMLLTTATDNLEIPFNSAAYTSADDGSEYSYEREIILSDESGLYLNADFLGTQANEECKVFEDGVHTLVDYQWGERTACEVKKDTKVRFGPGIKNLILTDAGKGERVWLLEQQEKWSRVVTTDGYIGYIPNKALSEPASVAFTRDFEAPEYPALLMDETVNLVWHQIGVPESNDYLEEDTADMTGVNVISPTWFFLSDNEGNFTSYASKKYVKKAHKMGLKVWGLVSNFSPDMSTSELVASTAARRNLARNLVDAALEVKMDGINVDLEAIKESAGYGYVQFVRELSVLCRKNGLVLSVDVPEPFDFNAHYDTKELATVADYVILMGYDEHYVGSEVGSVASLSFEENGIIRTLQDVPAEKIISGVPFYTRIWYTGTDGSVWSEIISMNPVTRTLESYGVTPVWNGETGQYYAEWTLDDGIVCRIWIEDETSVSMKADLVCKYGLGGIAEWALGNERASIWEVITRSLAGESSVVVAEQLAIMQGAQEETAAEEAVTEAPAEEAAAEAQEEAPVEEAAAEEAPAEDAPAGEQQEAGTEG